MEPADTIKMLEHRLATIEKNNRRMRAGIFAACAIAALPYLMGAGGGVAPAQTQVVRAREFQIVSGDTLFSTIRAITFRHGDRPDRGLGFFNSDGRLSAAFINTPMGGDLHIYNAAGNVVGSVFARSDAGGESIVATPGGTAIVSMFARSDSGGQINVNNSSGRTAAYVYARADGGGEIDVSNRSGTDVAYLFARSDGGGEVGISRPNGTRVVDILSTAEGDGLIAIANRAGDAAQRSQRSIEMSANESGGYVGVQNASFTRVAEMMARSDGGGEVHVLNTSRTLVGAMFTTGAGAGRLQLYSSGGEITHALPAQ